MASQGPPELEYYSALKRNEVRSFVEMWMDLEFVLQSEVSQKEKNKCHLLMHIHAIQKDGTDAPRCRAGMEKHEGMELWTQSGDKLGNWGSHINTTMCKRDNSWQHCWKRVFTMTSVFSWQNHFSLCPASFCTPRIPVTPGISWLPTFAFQSPIMKRTSFLNINSRKPYRSSCFCCCC